MVTYLDEGHLYLNSKGIIIPSVSKLINFELGNEYGSVPPEVLQKAADYGTRIHKAIQDYEELCVEDIPLGFLEDVTELRVLQMYIRLKKQCGFVVNSMEQIIDYQERYAGRYDMFCCDGCIYDIKTTSKVMMDHLEWQIGLYYLAMGLEKDIGYCIWLPKRDIPQLIEVEAKSNAECLDLLERYEKANANTVRNSWKAYGKAEAKVQKSWKLR